MRDRASQQQRASAVREVAYPVEHVWQAMATLLPYCSVCDVSVSVISPGQLRAGTEFRAFPGRRTERADGPDATPAADGPVAMRAADGPDATRPADGPVATRAADGGMPGEIIDWSPQRSVATRLEAGSETVVVRVEMSTATPDTTMVTISVEVTPHLRSRIAAAMSRSSYVRMARRTVEGEIEKLPAHLALLEEPER